MNEDETVSRLAGEIYDAALNPHLWPKAIAEIADYVGGVAGCLLKRNCVNGTGQVFFGFGDQPRYRRLYFEEYVRFDPISPALLSLRPGEVISNSSVTPREEFVRTRFYEEWMQPQGWLDNIFITLDRTPNELVALAISRGKGDGWADGGVFSRMQTIAPHLRRCVLLANAINHRTVQEETLADTLDGIAAGVIFIDVDGRIVHANASASAMLAETALRVAIMDLRYAGERIAAPALREAARQATDPDLVTGLKSVAIPLSAANGDRYVVHALPLTTGRRREAGAAHRAVAALFIQKAELAGAGATEVMARHYRLTPMELRVLLSIVETGDVPETAVALGIAETTAKTHLRRLFAKTGTSRQLELAKMVAGFSSAFSR